MNDIAKPGSQTKLVFGREVTVSGNAVVAPAVDLGPRPRFEWLPIDRLVIDERYQRRVTDQGVKLINGIVRQFRWSKFQPLTVSGPDASDDYPVIDGQHRLEACRRHGGIAEVPCWIVDAERIADQARAFVAVNGKRIRVTAINVFWASLAAADADAVWLKSICDRAGIAIGRVGNGVQPPRTTVALGALLKVRSLGDATVARALAVLANAQPTADNAFRSATIIALARLIGLHGDRIDDARMAEKLADLDLDDEIANARIYIKVHGGNTESGLQAIFARHYNQRLRDDLRLPEK